MKIISGAYWDKGKRELNQDSVTIQQALTSGGRALLAVVSDGIGGLKEGEIASGFIIEKLVENFYGRTASLLGRKKGKKALMKNLLRCFYDINRELVSYGESKGIGLGATVSALFLWKNRYLIFHLGDSRVYLFRRGKVRQLTKDHSTGEKGITKCMGSFAFQYPDIYSGRIYGKSGFLLCTDGFYRRMEEDFFQALTPEDIDNETQIDRRLRDIGMAVKRKGESDNLSAVYVRAV
ncbi:MAG: serine/threonine-protein phosphatase [Clostridium sp.]|nr:serine/threonine-protein phosphatase [Clostridium sp.]